VLNNIENAVPPGARKTATTTTILIFQRTNAKPEVEVSSENITQNSWLIFTTTYVRVNVEVKVKLDLFKVTFRQWCENGNGAWRAPFNTYDNVPETIQKLPGILWVVSKSHEDFPAGTELNKEEIAKLVAEGAEEAIKALLE
jgi:hypothetical protein